MLGRMAFFGGIWLYTGWLLGLGQGFHRPQAPQTTQFLLLITIIGLILSALSPPIPSPHPAQAIHTMQESKRLPFARQPFRFFYFFLRFIPAPYLYLLSFRTTHHMTNRTASNRPTTASTPSTICTKVRNVVMIWVRFI